jgi:uracil-DNA glycosylase
MFLDIAKEMFEKCFFQTQKDIHRCSACPLAKDPEFVQHVTFRGNPHAKVWLVGEAPGKQEEKLGSPFVGPAGEVLEKMACGLHLSLEKDFYITNVVKCRPRSPRGSGRENKPPSKECRKACRQHIEMELRLLKPEIVVLLGGSAIKSFLDKEDIVVGDYVGKNFTWQGPDGRDIMVYCMYHPAALLHSKQKGQVEYDRMKMTMWEHAKELKRLMNKEKKDE